MRYKRLRQQETAKTPFNHQGMKTYLPSFLPWYGFSFEEGYSFAHLDGTMIGTHEAEKSGVREWVDANLSEPLF